MKGSYFLGNGAFEVRDMDKPVLMDDEVLIKVMAAGVCGTDVHIYHGDAGSAEVTPPVVLGHEYAGIVTEAGSKVDGIAPGDHVAVDPNIYCGYCEPCQSGKKQFCEHLLALGVNRNGGFAQYSVAPRTQCYKLAPSLSFDAGALAEPLACCLHGIQMAGIRAGDTVCVVGGGAIGLLMVQLARLSGAARVLLSEPVSARRAAGLTVGADAAIDPGVQSPAEYIRREYGKKGADVVVECVGNPAAVHSAIEAAGFGSSVLLFSVPSPAATAELPLFDVFKKELNIKGSFINPDTQLQAVALLSSGRILTAPLITHSFGISEVEQAIQMQMSNDSLKVMVHPNG